MFNQKFGRSYNPLPQHKVAQPDASQAGRRNDEKTIDASHAQKQGKPKGGVKQRHKNLGKSNPGQMMRIPNAKGGGGNPMVKGGPANNADEY